MPARIPARKKQVSYWILHFIIFAVVMAILWYICYHGTSGFVYPWPIWINLAWGLSVIAHACLIWANHDDPKLTEWERQAAN